MLKKTKKPLFTGVFDYNLFKNVDYLLRCF